MPQFLDETIAYARQITSARLLVRMDAGHDDLEKLRRLKKKPQVDWIIKRNLRQESETEWLEVVVGPGGLQRVAVVRADQSPAERPLACREADADPQAGGPASVAERDSRPDVSGGPLDLSCHRSSSFLIITGARIGLTGRGCTSGDSF
jgi:hypothetical protein